MPMTIADLIVRSVAELPDRTSPEDWPEAMIVTDAELRSIVNRHVAETFGHDNARVSASPGDRTKAIMAMVRPLNGLMAYNAKSDCEKIEQEVAALEADLMQQALRADTAPHGAFGGTMHCRHCGAPSGAHRADYARVERSPLGIAAAMANCALGATLDGYPFKDEEIKDIRRRLTEALTGTVSEVGLQEAARAVLHDAKWLADAYEQNAAMAARFKALGDALAKNPNPTVAAVIDAPGPRHGWIPVGDRLPEGDDVVWIRVAATPIDNPMPWMGSGHYCRDDPFRDDPYWEAAGPLGWASPIDVTHWQPLDAKTEVPRPSEGRDFVKEARARFRLDSNVSYPSRVAANDVRRFIHEIADAYERLRILYMATCAVVHNLKAASPLPGPRPMRRLPYASPGDPRMAPMPLLRWGPRDPYPSVQCPHRVVPGMTEALACTRCGEPLPVCASNGPRP